MLRKKNTSSQAARETTGARIEKSARRWLQQQGLCFIESNYRCRQGEIDIVMLDQQQLVFIEVRYRKQDSFGSAAETVDWRKQQKLLKSAAHYLAHNRVHRRRVCRFDVIAVKPGEGPDGLCWQWFKAAFTG